MNLGLVGKAAVLLFLLSISLCCLASAQGAPQACSLPQYRQLDFWIGDWDAFEVGAPDKPIAHVQVDGILNGCVVHEDYQQSDGLKGQSYSIYDSSRGVWHQSWVTNRGQLLVIEGKFERGAIRMSGFDHSKNKPTLVRAIWEAMPGGVHEKAEKSNDGGKTWTTWFDIEFRPHKK